MRRQPLPTTRSGFEARLLRTRYPAYTEQLLKLIDRANLDSHAESAAIDQAFRRIARLGPKKTKTISAANEFLSPTEKLVTLSGYVTAAQRYMEELERATEDDIQLQYDDWAAEHDAARTEKAKQDDRWRYHLKENEADYEHWRGRPLWTADEAVALSLGKDPRRITADRLKPFRKVWRSPFTEEYGRRLADLERHMTLGKFEEPFPPKEFIDWANRNRIALDANFKRSFCLDEAKTQHLPAEDSRDESRRYKTLQKIVLAMAIDKYQYNTSTKSSAPTLISNLLEKLKEQAQRNNENFSAGGDHREIERFQAIERFYFDLSCSDSTIRSLLKEAASELGVVWPSRK